MYKTLYVKVKTTNNLFFVLCFFKRLNIPLLQLLLRLTKNNINKYNLLWSTKITFC